MERKILQEAAERFGTPSYLFDLDRLARRMETLKKALGSRAELCYAMKANPFLTGALRDLADRFEVCSPGEYDICRGGKAGDFRREQISGRHGPDDG